MTKRRTGWTTGPFEVLGFTSCRRELGASLLLVTNLLDLSAQLHGACTRAGRLVACVVLILLDGAACPVDLLGRCSFLDQPLDDVEGPDRRRWGSARQAASGLLRAGETGGA